MDSLLKVLYEKFFMRDILGKVTPGFIIVLTLLYFFGFTDYISNPNVQPKGPFLFILYIIAIPICYLFGLGLQISGEIIALHSPSPKPLSFFCVYRRKSWIKAFNEHRDRLAIINTKISEDNLRADIKAQRERFLYLKEGSGNLALALLFVSIIMIIKKPMSPIILENRLSLIIILIICSLLLEITHYLHGSRQASFEIRALRNANIISDNERDEMFLSIPKWTGERPF